MEKKQSATYAYFPGTGPQGLVCGQCEHCHDKSGRAKSGVKPKFCDKARLFINASLQTEEIDRYSPSCKYFEIARVSAA